MSQTSTKDKRLHSLRQQLLGKELVKNAGVQMKSTASFSYTARETPILNTNSSEMIYLKKDLLKILALITSAILIQLSLAYGLNHHLISMPKFY